MAARADCPAAPLASADDLVVSFLAGQGGTQAAPSTLFASTVMEGMLVYDDTANVLKLCNGTAWQTLAVGGAGVTAAGSVNGAVQFRGSDGNLAADDTNFVWDDTNNRLGIGTASPNTSALLDVSSTTKGILPPRMTTAQVTAIASPADGLIVYDETTDTIKLRANGAWVDLLAGAGAETDPQVGTLTANKWCAANAGGTAIDCTADAPTTGAAGSASEVQFRDSTTGAFAADSTFVWDDTNKRLGIGVAVPVSQLHLVGDSNVFWMDSYSETNGPTIGFRRARGTFAAPSAVQANDPIGFVGARGYQATGFISGSSAALRFYSQENFTDAAAGSFLTLETTPLGSITRQERLRIDAAGNVAIGITAPLHSLEAGRRYLSVRGVSDAGMLELVNNAADADGGTIGGIQFSSANYTDATNKMRGAAIMGRQDGTTANDRGGRLEFHTKTDAGPLAERMRITAAGKVGIGTTAPVGRLQVESATADALGIGGGLYLRSTGGTNHYTGIALDSDTPGSTKTLVMHYGDHTGTQGNQLRFGRYGDNYGYWEANPFIFDMDGPDGTIRTDDQGNVGIGTTSPAYRLDVAGPIATTGSNNIYVAADGNGTLVTRHIDGKQVGSTTLDHLYLNWANGLDVYVGGGATGSDLFVNANAYKPGGGSWTATSDVRLKNVSGDYERGLDAVQRLRVVRFHYKPDNPRNEPSDRPFVGLVAQDVQKVFPEAVKLRDDGYLDLDTTPIHFALINAVKELKTGHDSRDAEIETLKAENAELKAKNGSLRHDLDQLRRRVENLEYAK